MISSLFIQALLNYPDTVLISAGLIPALILFWFFYSQKNRGLPVGKLWFAYFLGIFATGPIAYVGIMISDVVIDFQGDIQVALFRSFVSAALIEEGFKYLALIFFSWKITNLRDPLTAMICGAAVALGFASVENIFYIHGDGLQTAVIRTFSALPCHGFLGGLMGYYLCWAINSRSWQKWLRYFQALLYPLVFHGFYDFPLMISGSSILKNREQVDFMLMAVSILLLIFLGIWVIRLFRLYANQERTIVLRDEIESQKLSNFAKHLPPIPGFSFKTSSLVEKHSFLVFRSFGYCFAGISLLAFGTFVGYLLLEVDGFSKGARVVQIRAILTLMIFGIVPLWTGVLLVRKGVGKFKVLVRQHEAPASNF